MLAERQGFEPWEPEKAQRFSRPPRSTTPAPLLVGSLDIIFCTHKRIILTIFRGGLLFIRLRASVIGSDFLMPAGLLKGV